MTTSSKVLVSSATDRSMVILPFSVTIESQDIRLFMNVQKISRVVEYQPLSPIPASMLPFCGLYDMDGLPVPVIDLSTYFQAHPESIINNGDQLRAAVKVPSSGRRIIVCHTMGAYIGLVIDKTRKVQSINNSDITMPPSFLNQVIFCAVVKDSHGFRYLLDIESLLADENVTIGNENQFSTNEQSILKGTKILFVDDSRYFQSLGKKLLEKFSATVDIAVDGQDGLNKFNANPDRYDLILTDIEMPVMSGIEMAKIIRKVEGRAIPIVFHSSISNMMLIDELKSQGIGDYIVKFDEKSVMDSLVKHLHLQPLKAA